MPEMRFFSENAVVSVRFVYFCRQTGDIDAGGGYVKVAPSLTKIDFENTEIAVFAGELDVKVGKSRVSEWRCG